MIFSHMEMRQSKEDMDASFSFVAIIIVLLLCFLFVHLSLPGTWIVHRVSSQSHVSAKLLVLRIPRQEGWDKPALWVPKAPGPVGTVFRIPCSETLEFTHEIAFARVQFLIQGFLIWPAGCI